MAPGSASRKHGLFDSSRFPPRERAEPVGPRSDTDRVAVEAREAEGGLVGASVRPASHPVALSGAELASLPENLTWEAFAALVYPGKSRHYFPAIRAWLQYQDSDRICAAPSTNAAPERPGSPAEQRDPSTTPQSSDDRGGPAA